MTLTNIDLHTAYEDDAAAAQEKVSAATLDADHLELERWINTELLPALAQIRRDDGTLIDNLVRYRNLHPECFASFTAGFGSSILAIPADGSVSNGKLAPGAVTADKISGTAGALQSAIGIPLAMQPVVQAVTTDAARTALGPFDEGDLAFTDVATNNASTTNHGFLKKLSGAAATYLNGLGNWVANLLWFAEGRSVAAPNTTVPVHSVAAYGGEADIDIAIVPKGTGAFALAIAANDANGGNKRGSWSVDLQMGRNTAGEVASGERSAILAGYANTAQGSYSVVLGGTNNRALHQDAICHGFGAVSRAINSRSHAKYLGGQTDEMLAEQTTSDASPSPLTLSFNVVPAVPLLDDECAMVMAHVVGYQQGATPNAAGYDVRFVVKRTSGVGSCSLVGAATITPWEDNAAWGCAVAADTIGGGANINVTGAAGVTIKWFASIRITRMNRNL